MRERGPVGLHRSLRRLITNDFSCVSSIFHSILGWGDNSREGGPNGKIQLFNDPQVNSTVIPIYKNRGNIIFEFGDRRLNPPH